MNSVKKLNKVNRFGVLRLSRNVFALQQNLTNLANFKEIHFEKGFKKLLIFFIHFVSSKVLFVVEYDRRGAIGIRRKST